MMKKMISVASIFAFISIGSICFGAGEEATYPQVVKTLDDAIAFYNSAGEDTAFAEFNKKGNKFLNGAIYPFVYTLDNATLLANPNPEKVGQSLIDVPDATGKNYFRRDIIKGVKEMGLVWVTYKYKKNPDDPVMIDKISYCKKLKTKGEDLAICVGDNQKK